MTASPIDGIKMIAFDVDGTLFSSEGIILSVYLQAIQEYKDSGANIVSIPSKEELLFQTGKPVRDIFQNLFPELSANERESMSVRVLELLCDSIRNGGGDFYSGLGSTLRYLKDQGYSLSCASNGRLPYIETVLETAGVRGFFEPIVTINQSSINSKGEILAAYIRKYSLPGNSIAMIGDRFSDWEAARQNGCRFAYCDYGHSPPGEVPDFEWKLIQLDDLKAIF